MMSEMGRMNQMGNVNQLGSMNGNMGFGANHGAVQGFTDPNSMAGMANHGSASGTNGLFGLGGGDFFGGLLTFAVDILALVVIIGLIAAAVVFFKRYVIDGNSLGVTTRSTCAKCGHTLKTGWSNCPKCGEARVGAAQVTTTKTQTV